MGARNHVAREISYAYSAQTKGGRALIRAVENATGRLSGSSAAPRATRRRSKQGRDFWQVMAERYGLSLDIVGGALDIIPKTGPLILSRTTPTASSTG